MSTYPGERRRRPRRLRRSWNAVYGILRFVAQHVQGVWSAYAAFLSVAFVGAAALAAFVGVARLMLEGVIQPWDEASLRWLAAHRTPLLTQLALQLTSLGTGLVLTVIIVISATFLWLTLHRQSAYLLLGSYFGSVVLEFLLKDLFERPRPSAALEITHPISASFPSGHAMTSLAGYGAIALLVSRLQRRRGARAFTWSLAALLVAIIGATRLYLGVHYPSDILGGYTAGLAWVAFAAAGMAALNFFGRRHAAPHRQERDLDRDAPPG